MKLASRIRIGVLPILAAWLGCNAIIGLELGEPEQGSSGATGSGGAGGAGGAGLPSGSVVWARQIGGPSDDRLSGVMVDPSTGDAVVSGCLAEPGAGSDGCSDNADVLVHRYSSEGELRWGRAIGAPSNQFAEDIAGGASGAVVAGYFEGNFDLGGPPLVSSGASDIFVAKVGPEGGHLWSARFGTASTEQAFRVATDPDENVILTGGFEDTVDFGGGPLAGTSALNPYLVKFDASGGLIWSEAFSATGPAYMLGVASDASRNVLLTGYFTDAIDFGNGSLATIPATSDGFVATFDPSGAPRWSQALSGVGFEAGTGIGADLDGNVVVVGIFNNTLDLGVPQPTAAGLFDIFVAKYAAASGQLVWATTFGGPGDDQPHHVIVDSEGQIVITGEFAEAADFQGTRLTSKGGSDAFLVRMGPDGVVTRAQRFGDIADDAGHSVAFGTSGEVFMAGSFGGTIQLGDEFLPSFGGTDGFLVKLTP
jgi:hypothetical protein